MAVITRVFLALLYKVSFEESILQLLIVVVIGRQIQAANVTSLGLVQHRGLIPRHVV